MNFARDIVGAAPPGRLALVELARDGGRREWSFGEVATHAGTLAAGLHHMGVRRGDVVLTLIGNRPEWVITMVACYRGLSTSGGTEGVGRATTQAVVMSSVLVLATDFFMTKLFIEIFGH